MTLLQIYVAPHLVLKKKTTPVEGGVTDDLRKLMDDMLDTMYTCDGIGLAAPQVGVSERVLVIDINQPKECDLSPKKKRGKPQFFMNPEILWSSEDLRIYNEGCLSVPGQYADVARSDKIHLKYLDYDGKTQEIEADGLLATVLQHEIDHLNGVLFIDHLSSLKRSILMRKLKKFIKENEEDMAKSYVL
ncbi:MAG: peptide deformylase [Alphaproteobacteria bacterium]|nr:peptide deformylase [Alphaproteobacteria bacterium]